MRSLGRRLFVGVVTVVVASAFEAMAYANFTEVRGLRERGETVPAVVVAAKAGKYPRITVRYDVRTGETIQSTTSNTDDAEVGQTIDVVYDRDDPYRMRAAATGANYAGAVAFGVFGVLALLVGGFLIRR